LKARSDSAVAPGMVFIPFCYAEAAANVLTNPQLDPFGKIRNTNSAPPRSNARPPRRRRIGLGRAPTLPSIAVGRVKRSATRHVRAFYLGGLRFATPALLLFALLTTLCDAGETVPASACLLPQQKPMLVAELFFGRNIAGRAPVSEAEWDDFVARVVTAEFPGRLHRVRRAPSGAVRRSRSAARSEARGAEDRARRGLPPPRPQGPHRGGFGRLTARRSNATLVGLLTRWECGAF